MLILVPVLSSFLAAAPADTPKTPVVKTAQRYRIKIPAGVKKPRVKADPMAGEIVLRASGGLSKWARLLKPKLSKTICPKMEKTKKQIDSGGVWQGLRKQETEGLHWHYRS